MFERPANSIGFLACFCRNDDRLSFHVIPAQVGIQRVPSFSYKADGNTLVDSCEATVYSLVQDSTI